jgi:molybdopterin/thiamine biosynthesis adenylyltransferase
MPLSKEETDRLLTHFIESGVLGEAERLPDEEAGAVGYAAVRGQKVRLRLKLPEGFPSALPNVYLEPWDALGFIPHVESSGKVCYFEKEGLVIDRRRPLVLLESALEEALDVLRRGVCGDNADEFAREFESYWLRLKGVKPIVSLVESDGRTRRVLWARSNKLKKRKSYLAEKQAQIEQFLSGEDVSGDYTMQNALFVPLRKEARVTPPRHDRPFWSASDLRSIVWENVCANDKKRLKRFCKKCSGHTGIILLGLPKPDGTRALVGIYFEQEKDGHPLIESGVTKTLRPLYVDRRDQGYLVPRGGGDANLSEKEVLLVGCGAVGGHLAFGLARAGVLNLTIVDPDTLRPENTFRHVLGRLSWGRDKVTALKTMLDLQMPYMRVKAVPVSIESALAEGTVGFADFDLVVFATGNPTVELEMNERLCSSPEGPPSIHTWLEPYGIGGHALLTGNEREGACFECLYQNPGDDAPYNRASFAAPGQSFGKTVSGCGSLFTPYGAADAARTATLAVRLAVDVLTGNEKGDPLHSWKGRSDAFEAAGFKLSHRYAHTKQQLHELRYAFADDDCPVCQKTRSNGEVEGHE